MTVKKLSPAMRAMMWISLGVPQATVWPIVSKSGVVIPITQATRHALQSRSLIADDGFTVTEEGRAWAAREVGMDWDDALCENYYEEHAPDEEARLTALRMQARAGLISGYSFRDEDHSEAIKECKTCHACLRKRSDDVVAATEIDESMWAKLTFYSAPEFGAFTHRDLPKAIPGTLNGLDRRGWAEPVPLDEYHNGIKANRLTAEGRSALLDHDHAEAIVIDRDVTLALDAIGMTWEQRHAEVAEANQVMPVAISDETSTRPLVRGTADELVEILHGIAEIYDAEKAPAQRYEYHTSGGGFDLHRVNADGSDEIVAHGHESGRAVILALSVSYGVSFDELRNVETGEQLTDRNADRGRSTEYDGVYYYWQPADGAADLDALDMLDFARGKSLGEYVNIVVDSAAAERERETNWMMSHGAHWNDPRRETWQRAMDATYVEAAAEDVSRANLSAALAEARRAADVIDAQALYERRKQLMTWRRSFGSDHTMPDRVRRTRDHADALAEDRDRKMLRLARRTRAYFLASLADPSGFWTGEKDSDVIERRMFVGLYSKLPVGDAYVLAHAEDVARTAAAALVA